MTNQEDVENQGFKVNDRRRFGPDGKPLREGDPGTDASTEASFQPSAATSEPIEREIPADFSSLLLSLAAGAQSALGLAPNPLSRKIEKNLTQAKYSIDLLAILQTKTKGNLQPEEEKLLETLLYDLRMQFIEAKK